MKKTLLAGASALAILAGGGGASAAGIGASPCTNVADCNAGNSHEANNNEGAVSQSSGAGNGSSHLVINGSGSVSQSASGDGNFAQRGLQRRQQPRSEQQ